MNAAVQKEKSRTLVPGYRHPDQLSQGTWAVVPWRWEQSAASGGSQFFLRAVLLLGGVQAALLLSVLSGPPCRGLGFLGHFVRHDSQALHSRGK